MKTPLLLLSLCAVLVAAPQRATAGGDPLLKCASSKLKAASKKESGKLNCQSKNAAKPDATALSACLGKVELAFGPAFTKADLKGACVGDPTAVENSIDAANGCIHVVQADVVGHCSVTKSLACVVDGDCPSGESCVTTSSHCSVTLSQLCATPADCPSGESCVATDPATGAKCTSAKLKAAAKGAGGELNCYSKAASKGLTLDPLTDPCLAKARDGVLAAFPKADKKGACLGSGAAALADTEQKCVSLVTGQIKGAPPLVCGNGFIEPSLGETCDDGALNGTSNDSCPSNCMVLSCNPQSGTHLQTSLTYTAPAGVNVGGINFLVDYPEDKVRVPTLAAKFGVAIQTKDLTWGYSGNALEGSIGTNLVSPFLTATFETCQGAPAPAASDFTCTVTDASDPDGNKIDLTGLTCAVTIP
jgi:cysteine-rich repeat protein